MAYPLLETNIGSNLILNHILFNINDPEVKKLGEPTEQLKFYEVIRCIDGVLLFFEDHMERLRNSVGQGIRFDPEQIYEDCNLLIRHLQMQNGNVKIVLTQDTQLIYANQFYYPPESEYETGLPTGLLEWERVDPNVKAVREDYKSAIKEKLAQSGPYGRYFETLLYGKDGGITEGSRSNVFFIRGSRVFTAPDELILKGITRKYILKAIENAGGELVVQTIHVPELSNGVDAAFISGTSLGVMPVHSVEDLLLSSGTNSLVREIRKEYEKIVKEYIEKREHPFH